MPKLVYQNTEYDLAACTRLVIGRSKAEVNLRIADRKISGKHAVLERREGCFYITDLMSSNGTCVNGEKISEACMLSNGDIIGLGEVEVRFVDEHEQQKITA